jgi:Protein of unknown function (DUF3575)
MSLVVLALFLQWTPAQAKASTANDLYNIRFGPLGLLIGFDSLHFDVAVAPDWTVGPEVTYMKWDLSDTQFNSLNWQEYSIGARANWFNNGVYNDGFYVGPSLSYQVAKLSATDNTGYYADVSTSYFVLGCLGGYGWFWDSFNIMLGLGAKTSLTSPTVTVNTSTGPTSVSIGVVSGIDTEFSLGFKF